MDLEDKETMFKAYLRAKKLKEDFSELQHEGRLMPKLCHNKTNSAQIIKIVLFLGRMSSIN
jgi:hypothetical protein